MAATATALECAVETAAGAAVLAGTAVGRLSDGVGVRSTTDAVNGSSGSAVGAAVGTGCGSRQTGGIGRAGARGTVGRLVRSG